MQVVIGPRQVGKTTGVLALKKTIGNSFIYETADSPVPPSSDWIRSHWQKALLKGNDAVLVLDEVQKVSGWSEVVKELYDRERRKKVPLRVILLGSASWNLQTGLTETLSGRYELLKVDHWSFVEHNRLSDWSLDQYLQFGGYPAPALLASEPERWKNFLLDSVIEPILSRDLLTMRHIAKPALFRQTLELVCKHPAQELSLQKLLGQLQDSGNSTTIKGYLELLETGFIIKCLSKFSTRPLSVKSSSPKLLPLCPALISAFDSPLRVLNDSEWKGRVFEAAVGAHLVTNFREVFYWRDGDKEVDFVIKPEKSPIGVEVKSGRKKNARGGKAFLETFKKAHLVALDFESGSDFLKADDPAGFLLTAL